MSKIQESKHLNTQCQIAFNWLISHYLFNGKTLYSSRNNGLNWMVYTKT